MLLVLALLWLLGVFSPGQKPPEQVLTVSPSPSPGVIAPVEATAQPSPAPASPAPTRTPEATAALSTGKRTLYELAARLDDEQSKFFCTMQVQYYNDTPDTLNQLCFRLYPNFFQTEAAIGGASLREYYPSGFDPGSISINSVALNGRLSYHSLSEDETLLFVPLAQDLPPEQTITATLEFVIQVPRMDNRFGETALGYQMGNCLPILAVYQDGGWDTRPFTALGDPFFSQTADYKAAISYPDDYDMACNGTILSQEQGGEGITVTYAAASRVRSFCWTLGSRMDCHVIEPDQSGGPRVISWALTGKSAQRGAELAAQALSVYGEMFGPYPYETFTLVQADLAAGGMEYPGMAMIGRKLYLDSRQRQLELTIAHEVAHQWFFALVGSDELGAPWMDEALCNYLGTVYFERVYGLERYQTMVDANLSDMAGGAYPIDGSLLTDYPDDSAYTDAVYVRGGAMFYALRETIGEEAFFAALKAYCRDHAYGIAAREDLIAAFEAASGMVLSDWFSGWCMPLPLG